MIEPVPSARVRAANDAPIRDGAYVLYWMIANRRPTWNFALQQALWRGQQLNRPVLVLEPLRVGYRWASDRLHRLVLDGMADNYRAFARAGVAYYPYLEPEEGAGSGLLEALAACACAVVTDDYPCFFLPRMVAAAARRLSVRLEEVDTNGLLPMRLPDRDFTRAYSLRRYLQKTLRPHLDAFPMADPLRAVSGPPASIPEAVSARWPPLAREALERDGAAWLAGLPIDHEVAPVPFRGGSETGEATVRSFLDERLARYDEARNRPGEDGASGLSPWLHFGHVSAHRVVAGIFERDGWTPDKLAREVTGSRGWWGVSEPAESFLDELVTWRELGFVYNTRHPDSYDRYESLPSWALETLAEHADDPREWLYDVGQLARAETHDPLWNAAQRQLVREGRIHNYLRMLWGKKVLEWTRSPHEALDVMVELNNRYAVDGRDPNSYSGIFWVLGRFDRAWGPQRPIFGKVRYMSSASTARKMSVKRYLARFAAQE